MITLPINHTPDRIYKAFDLYVEKILEFYSLEAWK